MNTRRSFFRRIGAIVAAVALAPEIAFRVKLPKVSPEPVNWKDVPFWYQETRTSFCYSDEYKRFMELAMQQGQRA